MAYENLCPRRAAPASDTNTYARSCFIVYSSVVGYDGAWNVRDEERSVGQKKLRRKPYRRRCWRSYLGFRGKTVWDWLPIGIAFLIPLVIALGTWRITTEQGKLEDQRAETERVLAEQRAQDEALQAYLDQMSQLMLDRNLLEAEPGDPVHTLAQARTSTAILRLDAEHNESVTLFLINSGLALRSKGSLAGRNKASANLL
jgi:hypothetical protein